MFLFEAGTSPITAAGFLPDGDAVAANREGVLFRIAPFREPEPLAKAAAIHDLEIASERIALATSEGWSLRDLAGDVSVQTGSKPVAAIRFLDGDRVAIAHGDPARPGPGSVELWSIAKNQKLAPSFSEPQGLRALDRCGRLLAWATGHQKLVVWDSTRPDTLDIPLKATAASIAFHPYTTRVLVSQDWNAKMVSLKTRVEQFTLSGHKGRVSRVAIHPGGQVLITGSWDGSVRLWSATTGEPLTFKTAPLGRITALAVDESRILAGGDAGKLAMWDFE